MVRDRREWEWLDGMGWEGGREGGRTVKKHAWQSSTMMVFTKFH